MRGHQKALLLFIVAALCAFLAWLWLRPRTVFEQTYHGGTLISWTTTFSEDYADDTPAKREAAAAIRALAANHLSALVEALNYDPAPRRKTFDARFSWLPSGARAWLRDGPLADHAEARARAALVAFQTVRTDSSSAAVSLQTLCLSTNPHVSFRAFGALSFLGSNSVPWLLTIMADESHPKRWPATQCFALIALHYGTNLPPAALPVLAGCMKSADANVATFATLGLGSLRMEPGTSVPLLITALTNPAPRIRSAAARALGQFGPEAAAAVPELTRARQGTNASTRTAVIGALSLITVDQASAPSGDTPTNTATDRH